MISSLNRLLLDSVVLLVLVQMVIVSASALQIDTDFKLEQENSQSPTQQEDNLPHIDREQFRRDMASQLLALQQAEAGVINRIRQLEAQRLALSQRKRSHYTSMCMFNVVACYKKRR